MRPSISAQELAGYGKLLKRMRSDARLNATHVSLFTALFVHWQKYAFASPFAVTRRELMAFSKIASIATYHKCIRELDAFGLKNAPKDAHEFCDFIRVLLFSNKL